jgi:hypothetical protein
MTDPNEIVKACRQLRSVGSNASQCNNFVTSVAARFGVPLRGTADQIVAQITDRANWTQHGNDGKAASEAADNGALAVGGMTSQDLGDAHGHVVIVVKGKPDRDKYPAACWGSLNAGIRPDGALGKTINFSFSRDDRDNVVYGSRMV